MDREVLVKGKLEAGERFLEQFANYKPVDGAMWIRFVNSDKWQLYVISDQIDHRTIPRDYQEVARIIYGMGHPDLDPFEVRLASRDDEVARAYLDSRSTAWSQLFRGRQIGGALLDKVLFYPKSFYQGPEPQTTTTPGSDAES